MRPIRLQVEGLTSFRTMQDVDFSDLDLFVITGATGSGKSSILDAMTLALYGNIPKTNKHELKELISLGSSQAKVQLDFEVGSQRYRIARRLPRKGSQKATFERLEGETAISEVESAGVLEANGRIEEVVGLDYDAFTRAVLLPQGAFSEFLKGDAKERRKILITLLDLDRFVRAGRRANEEAKRLEYEVSSKGELLEREYGDVTEDALKDAQKEAAEASDRADRGQGALESAKERMADRQRIASRRDQVAEIRTKLDSQLEDLARLGDTWSALKEKDEATRSAVERARRARTETEGERQEARSALQELTREIGTEADVTRLEAAARSLEDARRSIGDLSGAIEEAVRQQETLHESRADLEARLEAAERAEAEAKEALADASRRLELSRTALAAARQATTLRNDAEEAAKEVQRLESSLAEAKEAERAAGDWATEARERLTRLETENAAAALRSHLHQGDDCPVCGGEVGDLPATDPETKEELESARSELAEAEREAVEAGRRLSGLEATLSGARRTTEQTEARLEELGDVASQDEAEAEVAEAEDAEKAAAEALDEAAEDAKGISRELGDVRSEVAGVEATLRASRSSLEQEERRKSEAEEVLRAGLGEPLPEDIGAVIQERRRRIRAATSEATEADRAHDDAQAAYDRAASDRAELESDLSSLGAELSSQRALLVERVDALRGFGAEAPDRLPAPQTDDLDAETRALVEAVERGSGVAVSVFEEASRDLEGVDRTLLELAESVDVGVDEGGAGRVVDTLERAARERRRSADQAASAATTIEKRLEAKKEMLEEVDEQRKAQRLYRKVGSELQQNRFIAFLLNESFRDLAIRASDELQRISDGRYSLAAEGDSFEVIDHVNADERRSVVTLSGGETFLASLALALALAQGITDIAGQSAAARLEAMFIDEGFGTLDPTALDLAVEALERLRVGERMVGVITHVPMLAERIPGGLHVEKTGGGSVVVAR